MRQYIGFRPATATVVAAASTRRLISRVSSGSMVLYCSKNPRRSAYFSMRFRVNGSSHRFLCESERVMAHESIIHGAHSLQGDKRGYVPYWRNKASVAFFSTSFCWQWLCQVELSIFQWEHCTFNRSVTLNRQVETDVWHSWDVGHDVSRATGHIHSYYLVW